MHEEGVGDEAGRGGGLQPLFQSLSGAEKAPLSEESVQGYREELVCDGAKTAEVRCWHIEFEVWNLLSLDVVLFARSAGLPSA